MAEEVPMTSTSLKTLSLKRASSNLHDQNCMKKHGKGKNIVLDPPTSDVKICKNAACRAIISLELKFCKRCSCYICESFDDNKEPSKWLECSSGFEESCGFSCHVECAFQKNIKDGSYSCAKCGRDYPIIGCWKKQLIIAKACRRAKDLCERIFLSYRLLTGSSKYKKLHKVIEEVKDLLEDDLKSPINNPKDTYQLVYKLSSAEKVKELLSIAIENADKLMSTNSSLIPICDVSAEHQELSVTELGSGSAFKVHNTIVDLNNPPVPDLNEVPQDFDASKKLGLGDNFEEIVKTICSLENEGHIKNKFRLKFLTWFCLRAEEQDRRIVYAFQQAMADTPKCLAGQLIDTFEDIIFKKSA